MMHRNPPAFSRPMGYNGLSHAEEHSANDDQVGMELRDYFAAKAMHAEVVTAGALPEPRQALVDAAHEAGRTPIEQIAFNAYLLADTMLAQRLKLTSTQER
jgi:hypothetical protein